MFSKDTHSWLGRGRVTLKLNDHCTLNAEGTFHSRLGTHHLYMNMRMFAFCFKTIGEVTWRYITLQITCRCTGISCNIYSIICSDPQSD